MFNSKTAIIFLSATLFPLMVNAVHADFSGKWCWDKNNDVSAFALIINKTADKYQGGYYSVAQSGNKIDENDKAFTFNSIKKETVITQLKAGMSGNIGLIQLKILNDKKLYWSVLRPPKGEILVPKEATLYRCQ